MKEIKNILRGSDRYIYLILSDGTTERTDAARLEPIAAGDDWNEISNDAKRAARDILRDIAREKETAKEEAENCETCRSIAEELEAYACGDCVKCPHCGELHYKHDFEEEETEDGETVYKCPDCGEIIDDPDDLETLSIYNYFEDNDIFNTEYRIDDRGDLSSVEIMIACGGPNIYIDTEKAAVCLYWWGSAAQYPISSEAADAVEEWARECWEAIK